MFRSCLSCIGWNRDQAEDDEDGHDCQRQPDRDQDAFQPPRLKTQDAKISTLQRHFNQIHREFNQQVQDRQHQSSTSQDDNDEDEPSETTALLHDSATAQPRPKTPINNIPSNSSSADRWPSLGSVDHGSIPQAKFGLDPETLQQIREACESRTWESVDAPTEEEYNSWRVTTASAAPKGDIERPVRTVRAVAGAGGVGEG